MFRFICAMVLTALLWLTGSVVTFARDLSAERLPSLVAALRVETPLAFCGEVVPLNDPNVRERLEKELLLTLWDRPQVILWLKRSHRYMPHIEEQLAQNGLPADLKYITLEESALRPHVGSPKGALGFWQFMPATARKYGLTVSAASDERRNLFAATRAALAYLKDLHQLFGSWTLAAAAFNMGEHGLQSEILAQRVQNYYQLYLSIETQRYLFRILAAKLIMSEPERYGFELESQDLYAPLEFERVQLTCTRKTPLHLVAWAAGTHFKAIKDLNPHIRGHHLAAGNHQLLLPLGTQDGFHSRFNQLTYEWFASEEERIYVVQKGDNLSTIAERFNVPLPALFIWNPLELGKPIHPGQRLIIHPPGATFGPQGVE